MRRKLALHKWFTSSDDTGESGQAIVLIGLATMVLIAIMGLAIDGGRLLFLKRETQNASDAAAIAAARALCEGRADYVKAGEDAAAANGFVDGESGDVVTIVSPPTQASVPIEDECEGCYVEVTVGGEIPASFIGIVYNGPLQTTSYAIGVCNPNQFNLSADDEDTLHALFNLSADCQTKVTGAGYDIIGGVHANGYFFLNPSAGAGGTGTVYGPASHTGDIHSGWTKGVYCPPDCPDGYEWGGSGGGYATPAGRCAPSCFDSGGGGGGSGGSGGSGGCTPGDYPAANPYQVCEELADPFSYQLTDFDGPEDPFVQAAIADPDAGYYDYTASGGACNKNGTKAWINGMISGGTLPTGLYYFGNCEIQLQNFDNISGEITWVSGGPMKISGGTNNLHAYTDGLLFYSDAGGDSCNGKAVTLPGNSNTLEGNVYAPHGLLHFSASSTTINGCLVGYEVALTGSQATVICDTTAGTTGGDPGIFLAE